MRARGDADFRDAARAAAMRETIEKKPNGSSLIPVIENAENPAVANEFQLNGNGKPSSRQPEPSASSPFTIDERGVYYKGDWICPKLEVIGRTRDFSGQGCGKLLKFRDWEQRERQVILPLSTLIGDGREAIERLGFVYK